MATKVIAGKKSAEELADYLLGLPTVATARPFKIAINDLVYTSAAVYTTHEPPQEERIYVLGERPSACKRSSRVCFRYNNDDWYIASYSLASSKEEFLAEHPMFQVFRWGVPSGKQIDAHDDRPYKRLRMVTFPRM